MTKKVVFILRVLHGWRLRSVHNQESGRLWLLSIISLKQCIAMLHLCQKKSYIMFRHEICQKKITQPDIQCLKFYTSEPRKSRLFSLKINGVTHCNVFWKKLHSWQKIYTTASRGGRDISQLCSCYFRLHWMEEVMRGGLVPDSGDQCHLTNTSVIDVAIGSVPAQIKNYGPHWRRPRWLRQSRTHH